MKVLIIDNYDSFTYNLVQLLDKKGVETVVWKNDSVSQKEIEKIDPDKMVISPGPGTPETAGNCLNIVNKLKSKLPILGVCLGMQIIARSFGAEIKKAKFLKHGKISLINHDEKTIFANIPQNFKACQYNSLEVKKELFPKSLEISATADDNSIMGIRHKKLHLEGVQFHPEAILTEWGEKLIQNWLSMS